jgi:hypothetical protein
MASNYQQARGQAEEAVLASCWFLGIPWILKREAISSSEISVKLYHSTWRQIPKQSTLLSSNLYLVGQIFYIQLIYFYILLQ